MNGLALTLLQILLVVASGRAMGLLLRRLSGLTLKFTYVKVADERETIVARGETEIACLRGTAAAPVPEELREALRPYRDEAA
jgi:acyl-CoA thioesterase FadM